MGTRRWITDPLGMEWVVYDAPRELRFEARTEARYIRRGEFPENWTTLDDQGLLVLLDRAIRHTSSGLVPCRLHFRDGSEREHVVSNPAPDRVSVGDRGGTVRTLERRAMPTKDGMTHYFEIAG